MTELETFLAKFNEADWLAAVDGLQREIHDVDSNAVQIWFRFYPLELKRYISSAPDRDVALRELLMQGDYDLSNQIDTSHHFLYGHRYWPEVKAAIETAATSFTDGDKKLVDVIKQIGGVGAGKLKVAPNLVNAIAAVGLATLNQTGLEAFKAAPGPVSKAKGLMAKDPDAIVAERAKDDSQGLLGFLKRVDKKFSVAFSAKDFAGKFPIMNDQEIASGSAADRSQDWQSIDHRCWNGPVPVECTAASCGTCWIGVLGGQEKLTEVQRRERRRMKVFGYNQPEDDKPFLRLACQARALANATIVIPPWNAVFG